MLIPSDYTQLLRTHTRRQAGRQRRGVLGPQLERESAGFQGLYENDLVALFSLMHRCASSHRYERGSGIKGNEEVVGVRGLDL